jgi:hypothetical protein
VEALLCLVLGAASSVLRCYRSVLYFLDSKVAVKGKAQSKDRKWWQGCQTFLLLSVNLTAVPYHFSSLILCPPVNGAGAVCDQKTSNSN